jgi:hypothetical protein
LIVGTLVESGVCVKSRHTFYRKVFKIETHIVRNVVLKI